MLKKASSKKKKWLLVPVAGVLTAAIIAGTVYDTSENSVARVSLPGIEKINQSNGHSDPFTILEIVPSYSSAKVGYFVNGEEPAYYDDITGSKDEHGLLSLADMGSYDERHERYPSTDTVFSNATDANHYFANYSTLKGSPFTRNEDYVEDDLIADPSATARANVFTTYGSFVEKAVPTDEADYQDSRSGASAYKQIVSPLYDADDTHEEYKMKNIVLTNHNATTGVVYDDEVEYSYGKGAGNILYFRPVEDAKLVDSNASFPYQLDSEYTDDYSLAGLSSSDFLKTTPELNNPNGPYNWNYYVATPVFSQVLDSTVITDPDFDLAAYINIPTDEVLPIYVDEDGVDAEGYYRDPSYDPANPSAYSYTGYLGYVYYDATYGWCFYDESQSPAAVYTNLLNESSITELCGLSQLLSDYESIYTSGTEVFYTMTPYNSWDSDTLPANLYYVAKMDTASAPGYGFASFVETDKVARLMAGQDPTQYGFSVTDTLSYHTFYYLNNTPVAEFQYYTRAGFTDRTDSTLTHNFISDYKGDVNETFTYDGGFVNNDWLKQYVLDRDLVDCDSTVVDVVTKLACDVTAEDIQNAKLIYVNGDSDYGKPAYGKTVDLSEEAAKALLSSYKDKKAIVIDANDIIATNATLDAQKKITALKNTDAENIVKLSVALLQTSLSDADIDAICNNWGEADFLQARYGDKRVINDKGYTKQSVFLAPSSSVGEVFSTTFITELTDGKTDFADVQKSIEEEIFYLKVAYGDQGYLSTGFNDKISYATIVRYILSYGDGRVTTKDEYRILDLEPFYSQDYENDKSLFGTKFNEKNNWGGLNTYTDNGAATRNRDIFDANWFKKNVCEEKTAPTVTVTGMGTREFVGSITDLNANYDMIYIGMDTLYMNTFQDNGKKGTKTAYNEQALNGLVYTHVGDKMTFVGGNDANASGTYRVGGNDLTFEKLRDLETYVEAGYAVLLSNNFFNYDNNGKITGINTSKVDEYSYMYDFIKLCLYGAKYVDSNGEVHAVDINAAMRSNDQTHGYMGKNVYVVKDLDKDGQFSFMAGTTSTKSNEKKLSYGSSFTKNRQNFADYLNIQKLLVTPIEIPTEYYQVVNGKGEVGHYLNAKGGNYYLDYTVELTNLSAVGSPTYDCKLYIDVDADGRYSDLEAQDLHDITTSSGTPVSKNNGRFELNTGTIYNISLQVPEGFKGFLSWKLEFTENDRKSSSGEDLVKSGIKGYSAIPDYEDQDVIDVLQITSGNEGTNLDLTSAEMNTLYGQVQDFKINVKKISADYFVYSVDDNQKLSYLENYDMVVMGFADVYKLPYDGNRSRRTYEAVYALREYILAGNSMLFTHDLNSPYTNYPQRKDSWGSFLNEFIRELQGMDRYGMTQNHIKELETTVGKTCTPYQSRYDNDQGYTDIWGNASNKVSNSRYNLAVTDSSKSNYVDSWGLIYGQFNKYRDNNDLGDVSRNDLRKLSQNESYGSNNDKPIKNSVDNFTSNRVSMVNEGQITDYPFHIGESLEVATTHPQYFQLNLDTDSRDDNFNDDIVVWYAIDGYSNGKNSSYYSMDHNDARNNYYIFNKGNITYTGSGHALIGKDKEMERKLFVNTLVAAYTVGNHAPKVTFKESPWSESANITAKYEPYDIDLVNAVGSEGSALSDYVTVNFKVVNSNLKNNVEKDTTTNEYKYKQIHVKYYVEDPNGNLTIQNGNKGQLILREIDPSTIKLTKVVDSEGNRVSNPTPFSSNDDKLLLDNYAVYTAEISNTYLLRTSVDAEDVNKLNLAKHAVKIYIRASMDEIGNETNINTFPSSESLNGLDINFTELYELR